MNFQNYVDMCSSSCVILSVERKGNNAGNIKIVCANDKCKEVIGDNYYDDMPYTNFIPKDNKFEDICYRCAVLKKNMHAYVETKFLNNWTEYFLYPIEVEQKNIFYCQLVFEFTRHARAEKLKNVPIEIAEEIIKECVYFHRNESLETSMVNVCKSILEYSNSQICRVLLLNDENRRAYTFADYMTFDTLPNNIGIKAGEEIPYHLAKSWEETLGESNCFIIKNKRDFEEIKAKNAEWYESLKLFKIKNLIMLPLYRQKDIIGYLYVANYSTKKTIEVKKLLELSSFFVSSELSNYDLLKKFETLSKVDELTGLLNRNAMNECFNYYRKGNEEISGVAVLDLNGLKQVNDNYGHFAGDNLIYNSANAIKEIFTDDKIFRIGGDEFLVVTSDKNKVRFKNKVRKMKEKSNSEVNFAVGAYWLKEKEDINSAVMIADKLMYINKNEYYNKHPEKERRM